MGKGCAMGMGSNSGAPPDLVPRVDDPLTQTAYVRRLQTKGGKKQAIQSLIGSRQRMYYKSPCSESLPLEDNLFCD